MKIVRNYTEDAILWCFFY